MGEVSYKPLIEDMTWSYSRLQSFCDCPYRFYLKYIHGENDEPRFYASYGSFVHKIIEKYYKGFLKKEELLSEYLLHFKENVSGIKPSDSTVSKYIEDGANYFRSFSPFPFNMLSVEKRVEFNKDDNKFVGYIDYVGEKDNKIYIVDNKSRDLKPRSNRKNPTQKDAELDSMLKQLYLYSIPIKNEYGRFPDFLCFNCYRTGIFIQEPFIVEKYNEAIKCVNKTIEDIENCEDFYPRIEYFPCKYICGVSEECCYKY